MTENIKEIALRACDILDEKMGTDIVCLDITQMTIIADYFVIASGRNPNHVKSLYDELEVKMEDLGFPLVRSEGYNEGRWIVMDFSVIIVHLFYEPEREFYHLERLWDDGRNRVPYEKKD
ncbi:MAG TPA: ribosome silencing factor [Candidatus Spyradocola merdavium]|nr:ribosome silencing factor [Candidatus Spyradocola merdavium]